MSVCADDDFRTKRRFRVVIFVNTNLDLATTSDLLPRQLYVEVLHERNRQNSLDWKCEPNNGRGLLIWKYIE